MWIIYDAEGTPCGVITDEAAKTTTIVRVLRGQDFKVELCGRYPIVEDEEGW